MRVNGHATGQGTSRPESHHQRHAREHPAQRRGWPARRARAGKEIFATHYVNASLETVSRFHILTDRQIRREIARKALRRLLPHRPVYAYEFKGIRHDTGNKLGFLRAVVYFALRHPELAAPFAQHLRSLDLHPPSRSGREKDHPPVHIPGLI